MYSIVTCLHFDIIKDGIVLWYGDRSYALSLRWPSQKLWQVCVEIQSKVCTSMYNKIFCFNTFCIFLQLANYNDCLGSPYIYLYIKNNHMQKAIKLHLETENFVLYTNTNILLFKSKSELFKKNIYSSFLYNCRNQRLNKVKIFLKIVISKICNS